MGKSLWTHRLIWRNWPLGIRLKKPDGLLSDEVYTLIKLKY